MGKSSTTVYPAYSGGTVSVNGQTKASSYKKGDRIISSYNMSDAEKRAYDYAQQSFADSLPKINVFDADTQKNLQSQLDAYTANGQKILSNLYTPMLKNLKTDIASRFGNFDNSIFMDNLNSIESSRADAMKGLAEDITAKRNELVSGELAQRYTYLSFLQDIQNQTNSNILNMMNASMQNSAAGNNYNSQAYAANYAANSSSSGSSGNALGSYGNLLTSAAIMGGNPYGMAASVALNIIGNYL